MVIGKYRITRRGYVVFGTTGIVLILAVVMLVTQTFGPAQKQVNLNTNGTSTQAQSSGNGSGTTAGAANAGNNSNNTTGSNTATGQSNTSADLSSAEKNQLMETVRCTIYFKPDDYTLSEDYYAQLNGVVEMSKRFKDVKIILDGHFNGIPGEKTTEFRVGLAQSRAEMVEAYLISQGVDSERLIINNLGCSEPVNKDDSWQEIQKNRRVEVYFESLK